MCFEKCPAGWPSGPSDGYFFDHLREHLVAAGRGSELLSLLQELPWLEAKIGGGLTFDLPADFRAAVDAVDETDPNRRIVRLLDEAALGAVASGCGWAVLTPRSTWPAPYRTQRRPPWPPSPSAWARSWQPPRASPHVRDQVGWDAGAVEVR